MGLKVLPDLWARPRAQGASRALARSVGRGRDLTFPRRLVPFACRARPDNLDAPRGAMGEAYAIRDALSVMAGLVQVKPGHDDTGRFGDAMSSHSG